MAEGGPDFDLLKADEIPGNATVETKQIVSRWLYLFTHRGTGFGDKIGQRVKLTEISYACFLARPRRPDSYLAASLNAMPNEPERMEGKVVGEITITEGQCHSKIQR